MWSLIRRLDDCLVTKFFSRADYETVERGGLDWPDYRKILRLLIAEISRFPSKPYIHWKILLLIKMSKRKKDEGKLKSFQNMADDLTEGFR